MTPEHLYESIRGAVVGAGYRWFVGDPFDLNLVAFRGPSRVAGYFDDLLTCSYLVSGRPRVHVWPFTTDPSPHYLRQPVNPRGTLIVAAGQYPGAYRIGTHKSRPALVQCGPLRIHRDDDRDTILEWDPSDPGTVGKHFAANLHDSRVAVADRAEAVSAGCQTQPLRAENAAIRDLLARQEGAGFGSTVTYTLIEARDPS